MWVGSTLQGHRLQKPQYAILLDGGYLTKKLLERNGRPATADDIEAECDRLRAIPCVADYELLRIYYYDAYPSTETVRWPISNTLYPLGNTPRFQQAQALYDQLILKPNVALRMGHVALGPNHWKMKPRAAKQLKQNPRPLVDADFTLDMSQKGVDIRIGMDMARLALRDMVRTIVVVTGDTDFVPAFKYVRREGVKVVLDPIGGGGRVELHRHADIVIQTPRPPQVEAEAEPAQEAAEG